jgi:hypothetical protein
LTIESVLQSLIAQGQQHGIATGVARSLQNLDSPSWLNQRHYPLSTYGSSASCCAFIPTMNFINKKYRALMIEFTTITAAATPSGDLLFYSSLRIMRRMPPSFVQQ